MSVKDLVEAGDQSEERRPDRLIVMYIGVLAICRIGGNATQNVMAGVIEVGNTWAFFKPRTFGVISCDLRWISWWTYWQPNPICRSLDAR